jgi:hypothetical protein
MVDTVGKGGAGGKITSPFLSGSRRKIKKRLKELKEQKEARRVQTEKDLKYSDPRPSPTITKTEAIARSNAKKEALIQKRKEMETKWLIPIKDRVIADLHKKFPQSIGGMGTSTGHGKGLGAKIGRLMGTTKESRQKERQYKRENKQVAKQRKQAGEPERREVKRPKSGLYKDTPKPKPKTTPKPKATTTPKQAIPPTKTQANGGPKRPDSEKFDY